MQKLSKHVVLAIIVYLFALLTGCMNGVEISNRAFVQAVWVDKNRTDFCVNLDVFEGASLYGEGATISQALANIEARGEKRLFLGHCQLLYVGNGITDLKGELTFFLTSNKLSPTLRIALLERGAVSADFSDAQLSLGALSSAANGARTVETDSVTFFGEDTALLPILRKKGNECVFSGCEVVKSGRRTYELSEIEVLGNRLLLGEISTFTLPVKVGNAVATVVADRVNQASDGGILIIGRVTETVGATSVPAVAGALKTELELLTGIRVECKLREQRKF